MGSFSFNINQFLKPGEAVTSSDEAKHFTINGPADLTQEQARAIFEKQVNTGSLTGFKAGEVLSAATQAVSGLASAQALVGGAMSTITGSLGAVVGAVTGGITSALGAATSITNGINPADFVKALPSLSSLGNLNTSQVTGALAQASKLVDQPSDLLSNAKGVGSFGLDAMQLETAGYIKPGTAAKYLSDGQNSVTSVLGSSSVWTGKDGVNQVENLLSNPAAQSGIQQGLMAAGVSQLTSLGLPTDKLSPQMLSGVALNASKDVTATLDWAKGATGALPAGLTAQFDKVAKDASFAVNLVDEKINDEALNVKEIVGSTNTVNRTTLTAAIGRVVGSEKIPSLSYGGGSIDTAAELALRVSSKQVSTIETKVNNIFSEALLSTNADAREARLNALKLEITSAATNLRTLKTTSTSKTFITKVDLAIANADLLIELITADIANIQRFKAGMQSI